MSTARAQRLYPNVFFNTYNSPHDYTPIINEFGVPLVRVDEDAYAGDTCVLLSEQPKDTPSRVGFLVFGWGSCSGCDALQACESYEDLEQLITQLEQSIRWFDTLSDAVTYITTPSNHTGSYYIHSPSPWPEFAECVSKYADAP